MGYIPRRNYANHVIYSAVPNSRETHGAESWRFAQTRGDTGAFVRATFAEACPTRMSKSHLLRSAVSSSATNYEEPRANLRVAIRVIRVATRRQSHSQ